MFFCGKVVSNIRHSYTWAQLDGLSRKNNIKRLEWKLELFNDDTLISSRYEYVIIFKNNLSDNDYHCVGDFMWLLPFVDSMYDSVISVLIGAADY